MGNFLLRINQMYNDGTNRNLGFNEIFFFDNDEHGRFVPRHHADDWDGVMYEGAKVEMKGHHEVQYVTVCTPTANSEFLLQEPESHLYTRAEPPM